MQVHKQEGKKGAHGHAWKLDGGAPARRNCWAMAQVAALPAACRPGLGTRVVGAINSATPTWFVALRCDYSVVMGTMTRPAEREPIRSGIRAHATARRLPPI